MRVSLFLEVQGLASYLENRILFRSCRNTPSVDAVLQMERDFAAKRAASGIQARDTKAPIAATIDVSTFFPPQYRVNNSMNPISSHICRCTSMS